jgi:preprotein translocase subunit SecG
MTFVLYLSVVLLIFVSLILILLVLIQKGRGGGLASAFGGGAGGHTAFGSKTGDVLTWATAIVVGVFLLLAIAANLIFNHVDASRKRPTAAVQKTSTTTAPVLPGQPGSSLPGPPGPDVNTPPQQPPAPTTQP